MSVAPHAAGDNALASSQCRPTAWGPEESAGLPCRPACAADHTGVRDRKGDPGYKPDSGMRYDAARFPLAPECLPSERGLPAAFPTAFREVARLCAPATIRASRRPAAQTLSSPTRLTNSG